MTQLFGLSQNSNEEKVVKKRYTNKVKKKEKKKRVSNLFGPCSGTLKCGILGFYL